MTTIEMMHSELGSPRNMANRSSKLKCVWFGLACLLCGLFLVGYLAGYLTLYSASGTVSECTEPLVPTETGKSSWRNGPCAVITGEHCPAGYKKSPPLLVVSFDGFRASYLERVNVPAFRRLQECGVHTLAMRPTHPAITFPNHYSIATGLFSESHGIVDNLFYDPEIKQQFSYKVPDVAVKPVWWKGEPIWVTAKKQGKRAYAYFWVGTEAEIQGVRPDLYVKFNNSHSFELRVDTVLDWLSQPDNTRPDVTMLYFSEPDSAGHSFGTQGAATTTVLTEVSVILDRLMQGLHDREILHCVNIMVLSDHGMEDMTCDKATFLQPIFDSSLLAGRLNQSDYFLNGGPVMGRISLRPSAGNVTSEEVFEALKCPNPTDAGVYSPYQPFRTKDFPRRLHYTNTVRVEPIVLNVQAGHTLHKSNSTAVWCDGGTHGYDNLYTSMDTIFLAQGPAFKSNFKIEAFQNVELYGLMCELLGVEPVANNGTLGSMHHVLRSPKPVSLETFQEEKIASFPSSADEVRRRQNPTCWALCGGGDNLDIDLRLNISSGESSHRLDASLPYGVIAIKNQTLLVNADYVLGYDERWHLPRWASWTTNSRNEIKDRVSTASVTCARSDVRLDPLETISCSDIPLGSASNLESSFLFPPGLVSMPQIASDVLIITNIVPMYPVFKRGIWSQFWDIVGIWTLRGWKLNIVSGPVFDSSPPYGVIDPPSNEPFLASYPKLRVPSHYFVVVTRDNRNASCVEKNCLPDVLAFLLPHTAEERLFCQDTASYILTHSATVFDVERVTGLRFYTQMPTYEAIRLRTQLPTKLWHLSKGL